MSQQHHLLGAVVAIVVILFVLYRQVRSHYGRQPIRAGRMRIRIVLMSCIAALFAVDSINMPRLLAGLLLGLLLGVLLAYVALRRTLIQRELDMAYYRSDPWIGSLLLALLFGRLVWRLWVTLPVAVAPVPMMHSPILGHSAITQILLGLTLGYYAVYYFGIIRRSGQILSLGPEPV